MSDKLSHFLKKKRMRYYVFAEQIGITKEYFSYLMNGRHPWTLPVARRIQDQTNGAICISDLIEGIK